MFDKFIWEKRNSLSPEFCAHLIDKFEKDSRKQPGVLGLNSDNSSTLKRGVDLDFKRSTDLYISPFKDEWGEEDRILFETLTKEIEEYESIHRFDGMIFKITHDKGFQIQRTKPGEFYVWHHDFHSNPKDGARILTYIWYLNDIHEDGYTEFINGRRIQPETGKLLIFPSTWTYVHRGVSPKTETKYICTGWACDNYFNC